MFVDFQAVKEAVCFADAVHYLDLAMKKQGNQFRGICPKCGGNERGLVLTEGKGYFCFSDHKGGDVIALAAHVLNIPTKEAAQRLAELAGIVQVPSTSTPAKPTVPESEGAEGSKLSPLSSLEPEHDAVVALGFDPEFCKLHGIGYAPRGVVRGSVAIPFRDEHGVLLGYIGLQDITYIPPNFQTNVVPFQKRA